MKLFHPNRVILFGLSLLLSANLFADPENFMIEELTFTRPPSWTWVYSDNEARRATLKVSPEAAGGVDVVFYFYPNDNLQGDPGGCVDRWRTQFVEPNTINARVEKLTVANRLVWYADMEGTYKGFGRERMRAPNHRLLGCVIQTAKGHITVRMTGPTDLVATCEADLKKMVAGALQEDQ